MSRQVTQEALLGAARRHQRPGITPHVAILLASAELAECPLDPQNRDHAALLLRAERLLMDDVPVAEAIKRAVREFVSFRHGGRP